MAVKITAGNTDDRKPFDTMTAALEDRIVGDNGFVSKHLFQELWKRGRYLITSIRRFEIRAYFNNHRPFCDGRCDMIWCLLVAVRGGSSGKNVIVIGGTSGINRGIAQVFAASDAKLAMAVAHRTKTMTR